MIAVYTKCSQITDKPEGAYGLVSIHVIRDAISRYNLHKGTIAPCKTTDNNPHRNPRHGRDIVTSILGESSNATVTTTPRSMWLHIPPSSALHHLTDSRANHYHKNRGFRLLWVLLPCG